MGWANIGYHNANAKTPHFDAAAQQGVILDRHYVFWSVHTPRRHGGRGTSLGGVGSSTQHAALGTAAQAEARL
jgi:arylsulfatase A-like enzyme